jgi:uncharacterized Zn finger protein
VLYLFADRLDDDPWLLLTWRGRTRDELLEPLRERTGRAVTPSDTPLVAPWWPFADGPLPPGLGEHGSDPLATPPEVAEAALARLPTLPVEVRGAPVTRLLVSAYEAICGDT